MIHVIGWFNGADVELHALFCKTSALNVIKMIRILTVPPRTPSLKALGPLLRSTQQGEPLLPLPWRMGSWKWKGVGLPSIKQTWCSYHTWTWKHTNWRLTIYISMKCTLQKYLGSIHQIADFFGAFRIGFHVEKSDLWEFLSECLHGASPTCLVRWHNSGKQGLFLKLLLVGNGQHSQTGGKDVLMDEYIDTREYIYTSAYIHLEIDSYSHTLTHVGVHIYKITPMHAHPHTSFPAVDAFLREPFIECLLFAVCKVLRIQREDMISALKKFPTCEKSEVWN